MLTECLELGSKMVPLLYPLCRFYSLNFDSLQIITVFNVIVSLEL